jgi:hypothetical protein
MASLLPLFQWNFASGIQNISTSAMQIAQIDPWQFGGETCFALHKILLWGLSHLPVRNRCRSHRAGGQA